MMVKICGITNVEDALAAIEGGAAALGFNFWPRSPRYVKPEAARKMINRLPATVWKAGVFVDETADAIAQTVRESGLDIAQLHGRETAADVPQGVRVWLATEFEFIWGVARGGMGEDSLREIDAGEEVRPVVLEVIYERAEALVDVLVQDLRVAIGLWVVGGS